MKNGFQSMNSSRIVSQAIDVMLYTQKRMRTPENVRSPQLWTNRKNDYLLQIIRFGPRREVAICICAMFISIVWLSVTTAKIICLNGCVMS